MMNSYFSLIYFKNMLNASLPGYRFDTALTARKNTLEVLFAKKNEDIKLIVSADSTETALFFDERTGTKRSNITRFFEELEEAAFLKAELAHRDRWLTLYFDAEFQLNFKLFSGKPNVFLSRNGNILSSFKEPEKFNGEPLPEPRPAINKPFSVTKGILKKRITSAFPLLPRDFISDLIESGNLHELEEQKTEQYLESAEKALMHNPVFRRLSDGRFCMFPNTFVPDSDAEVFDDINSAVKVCFFQKSSADKFHQLRKSILNKLEKESSRLKRMIEAAENAEMSLERAAKYEQYGNILLAHAHIGNVEDDSVELPNLYDNGTMITIPIKRELSIAENASYYFGKKKKSERSFEALVEQGEQAEKEIAEIDALMQKVTEPQTFHDLKTVVNSDRRFRTFLDTNSGSVKKSRPYAVTQLGPYEVWIGKNAKSNDAIVRDAHKEDIWMHARGFSGSHVVIRMNKSQQAPDLAYLEKAASIAAWKSKARGSEWVPVIWTKRKFVRKPKGAAHGAVVVEKENVLIVQPSDV